MSALVEAQWLVDQRVANGRRATGSAEWPPLDELPEPIAAVAAPFPLDALGPVLGPAARGLARDVQAPDALAAGSVLAATALAAQPHADVELTHGRAPLSLFVVSSAQSGDRKTALDAVACAPIEEHRRQQARVYAERLREHLADKGSREKGDVPVAQSLTVGKATTEGLHSMLRAQSHVGLFSGEGGELLGGYSLRDDRRSAGLSWLLKAWGGETLDELTRGNGLSLLPGRRVSMHLMVQPVLLHQLLADPLAKGQGLLARCLIAEPASLAGTRLYSGANPSASPEVKRYHDALHRLLNLKARVHERGDGFELTPRRIVLSEQAAALWVELYNEMECRQAKGGDLADAQPFASKAAEHAARIAGVITMAGDPQAREIGMEAMEGAIRVAVFYTGEHLRLTGSSVENLRLTRLHALADWFFARSSPVKAADVLQSTPRPLRPLKAMGLKPLLDELVQRGYIRATGTDWEVRR